MRLRQFFTLKVGLSPSKKDSCYLLGWKPSKNDEKYFLFHLKSPFPSQDILSLCHDFLVMQEKRIDQKDNINFKLYDVTTWFTHNFNTHTVQYLTKQKQSDNENLINLQNIIKIFFFRNHAENEAGRVSSRPLFVFKKKLNMR